jgi:hypothetical protein
MNLLLGISLPLASQQKNFFKVATRSLNQNDFNPLRCQGILKHFALQSKVVKPLSLQSNFVAKNLNINDGYIKKNALVKTLVFAKPSLSFFQSAWKHNCSIRQGLHSTMFFYDQSSAGLQLTDKGTVKPSEIFSLLGLDAQNLTDSPLEQLGLNPEF